MCHALDLSNTDFGCTILMMGADGRLGNVLIITQGLLESLGFENTIVGTVALDFDTTRSSFSFKLSGSINGLRTQQRNLVDVEQPSRSMVVEQSSTTETMVGSFHATGFRTSTTYRRFVLVNRNTVSRIHMISSDRVSDLRIQL